MGVGAEVQEAGERIAVGLEQQRQPDRPEAAPTRARS